MGRLSVFKAWHGLKKGDTVFGLKVFGAQLLSPELEFFCNIFLHLVQYRKIRICGERISKKFNETCLKIFQKFYKKSGIHFIYISYCIWNFRKFFKKVSLNFFEILSPQILIFRFWTRCKQNFAKNSSSGDRSCTPKSFRPKTGFPFFNPCGVPNYLDWISFCSYRKTEVHEGTPVHEIIYPHSKLMIVDDRHTVIGSSNINDRSRLIIHSLYHIQKRQDRGCIHCFQMWQRFFFVSKSAPILEIF